MPANSISEFPKLPPTAQMLFSLRKGESAWSRAVRSGLAFTVPAAIAIFIGHEAQMFLVISGAYAILFGAGGYRRRVHTVSVVAIILVGSAACAAALGWAIHVSTPTAGPATWSWLLPMLALCAFAALACFVITAIQLRAGTATFPVMVVGGSLLAYHSASLSLKSAADRSSAAQRPIVSAVAGWLIDHDHRAEGIRMFKTFPDNRVHNRPYRVLFASGDWTCSVARFTGTMTRTMAGANGAVIQPLENHSRWTSVPLPIGVRSRNHRGESLL